ncbi:MAG: hypothetical protein R6U20_10495 [Longimonas sp.]|uniref:hypothetical protein n=1 Tax=Longimonas sp. TaxID=2039626 RepID=UPI0039758784
MTASLFLVGLAWTLPLGFLAWSYYQHRVATRTRASFRIITKTVRVDVQSGAWMVTAPDNDSTQRTQSAADTLQESHQQESYQTEVTKGQAIVRVYTPTGDLTYRRCDTFLN